MNTQKTLYPWVNGRGWARPWVLLPLLMAGGCEKLSFKKQEEPRVQGPSNAAVLEPDAKISLTFTIERKDHQGPVNVSVTGLPEGVTSSPVHIADGANSATIELSADASLGDKQVDAKPTVVAQFKDKSVSNNFSLLLPAVPRPTIAPQQPFFIQPGTSSVWTIPFERNGYEKELLFEVDQSAPGVQVEASSVAANKSAVDLKIHVEQASADQSVSYTLKWTSYGRPMASPLRVIVARQPFSLPEPIVVTLRPDGQESESQLHLTRMGYDGAVSFRLDALPAGIRAAIDDAAEGSTVATLHVKADRTALESASIVPIHAAAGHLHADGIVVVRVLGDTEPTSLPQKIVAGLQRAGRIRKGSISARSIDAARENLRAFYGTTAQCMPATGLGLRWLASIQSEDGSWSADNRDPIETSAAAVLPFLAEGITHEQSSTEFPDADFPTLVKKGLSRLAQSQSTAKDDTEGRIGETFSAHLLGLTAVSEAFALSGNDKLKNHSKKAIEYLVRQQQKKQGGWDDSDGMTSYATASAILALRTSKACGMGVPSLAFTKGEKFIESCQAGPAEHPGAGYALRPRGIQDDDATAACLLVSQYKGTPKTSADLLSGCDFLLLNAPAIRASRVNCSINFLLNAGQVLRNVEGKHFDRWNGSVRHFLVSNQVKDGPLAGSWNPETFSPAVDRVRTTAFAILCLQSHYRYLPLYRLASKAPEDDETPSSEDSEGE